MNWFYSNHALRPDIQLHEKPDLTLLDSKGFWKMGGGTALFARWITDFDCGYETEWWNVILDKPFEIESLKSKRRYEIRKGDKNFDVRQVNYEDEKESLYLVYEDSKKGFPPHLQKNFTRENFEDIFVEQKGAYIFGAYSKETNELNAWAFLRKIGRYIGFIALRSMIDAERDNVNFALIHAIVDYFRQDIIDGCYIDDGTRPVLHTTTNFQSFLEKYFCFRKAYSVLHIQYRTGFGFLVKMLYPFRNLFKGTNVKLGREIYGVLLQEEIVRTMKEK